MEERVTTGGCLCGAVQYEVEGPATEVTSCHCPRCRKQHGAAFATYGGYANERVRVTSGGEALQVYRSGPTTGRRFCGCAVRVCSGWIRRAGGPGWLWEPWMANRGDRSTAISSWEQR